MPQRRIPPEIKADPDLYAGWRYNHQTENEAALFKEQGLSVNAMLAVFRDEWHREQHAIAMLAQRTDAPAQPQRTGSRKQGR